MVGSSITFTSCELNPNLTPQYKYNLHQKGDAGGPVITWKTGPAQDNPDRPHDCLCDGVYQEGDDFTGSDFGKPAQFPHAPDSAVLIICFSSSHRAEQKE